MFIHRVSSTDMELVLLISLFLLTANTFGDGTGSDVTRLIVKEDDDAILMCSFSESIIDNMFDWKKQEDKKKEVFFYNKGKHYNNGRSGQDEQFKGRVFHFEDRLKSGNASIVIRKTQPVDSGNYTCDFPLHSPPTPTYVELIIRASPKPYVTIINATKNGRALLECSVEGASPEPVVEWMDGAGNILHAEEPEVTKNKEKENSFNVILLINVNKSDRYTCVSTQEKIDHQISNKIYVPINASGGMSTAAGGHIVGLIVGLILGLILL
ncbi:V-set domain-containing T-cell activation inhibitor 1-like [Brachyistius frenatus]|uniref:V-set domain-containing T-cell activation inhibitor 1-like n=1 Tax=Brachyistius frenatus TaxID=100188 RepID=UPI0037E888ED